MRIAASILILSAVLVSCGAPARPVPPEPDPGHADPETPSVWCEHRIQQLGNEDATSRDLAAAELLGRAEQLSEADLAAIEVASRSGDVERAARACNLHRDIVLRQALGPALLSDLRDFEADRLEDDGTARPLLERAAGRWNGGSVDDEQVEALVEIVTRHGWQHGLDVRFMQENRVRPFARLFQQEGDYDRAILLGWAGSRRSMADLVALLESEVPVVQQEAARALGRVGETSAGAALLRMLDSSHEFVRAAALWSLAELKVDIADGKLEAALADDDEEVRRAAAYAVARLRKDSQTIALAKAWEREDGLWRRYFLSYLAHLSDERLHSAYRKELLRNDLGSRLMVAEAYIRTTRPWHAQEVADLISSGIATALDVAPDAVARLDPAEAKAVLLPLLKDPRPEVRAATVEALAGLRDDSVADLLLSATHDPDARVRDIAFWALGRRSDHSARLGLEALKDARTAVAGIRYLGCIGAIEGRDAIVTKLGDEDSEVRRAAVEALRDLDAREALPAIRNLITDRAEDVRKEAIFTVILWAEDSDHGFLKDQAERGGSRDRTLAASELQFRGDSSHLEWLRKGVGSAGYFGEDYWDGRLALLKPLFAETCLDALDSGRNPGQIFFHLAWLAEAAALTWNEPDRNKLLERLRRLSDHPDERTRMSARFSRFYLEETPPKVQLKVLAEMRDFLDPDHFLIDPFLRSLAFANAREAFRDLGIPVRLTQELRGDAGIAAQLRARGYELDSPAPGFVGRRAAGSWITALSSLERYRGAFAIEGKKIRLLNSEDPLEYWKKRLER